MAEGNFLTSGQVAALCGVTIRTVQMWHKKRWLVPYFVSPGGDRRYLKKEVERFMRMRDGFNT